MYESFPGAKEGTPLNIQARRIFQMHKPRSVTRANKKKGFPPEEPMTIRNDAGYYAPTPYFAFKNMEREARRDTAALRNTERTTMRRAG